MNDSKNTLYSYITVLSTDNYLYGVIILYHSLKNTKTKYNFLCLTTPNIKNETKNILKQHNIKTENIQSITNPYNNDPNDRKIHNYSKLNIFNLHQFKKIVYLDADMLILQNIDELFNKPHMSAVNANGLLEKYKNWNHLNSGIMVIEPNKKLFNDIKSKIGKIEKEKNRGDQEFLQNYYKEWPNNKELHLDYCYNSINNNLDDYKQYGYYIDTKIYTNNNSYDPKRIKIIHFTGQNKPWSHMNIIKKHINSQNISLQKMAEILWLLHYISLDNKPKINKNENILSKKTKTK